MKMKGDREPKTCVFLGEKSNHVFDIKREKLKFFFVGGGGTDFGFTKSSSSVNTVTVKATEKQI
jgi:hypothetical protein